MYVFVYAEANHQRFQSFSFGNFRKLVEQKNVRTPQFDLL